MPGTPRRDRGVLVLWGLLANSPFGGMTWQVFHHLEAFRRLGFDVWYVEDLNTPCLDPVTRFHSIDFGPNVDYLAEHLEELGLAERWFVRPWGPGSGCIGRGDEADLQRLYRDADVVVNLCGSHLVRDDHEGIRRLVYLQTDPVQAQIEVAEGEEWRRRELDQYGHLFTYGERVGHPDCPLPTAGYAWQPTRAPVVTEWWAAPEQPRPTLTTVANWTSEGKAVVWEGERYDWEKRIEFHKIVGLPRRVEVPLELAVDSVGDADRVLLQRHGWGLTDAAALDAPDAYRRYITSSLGEFTVAKDQNIRMQTGWFSDRSACYLAAGRPVITQSTGFEHALPTGEGLFSFCTEDEAAAAIDAVLSDYRRHAAAAAEIAREHFEATSVLDGVMARVGL